MSQSFRDQCGTVRSWSKVSTRVLRPGCGWRFVQTAHKAVRAWGWQSTPDRSAALPSKPHIGDKFIICYERRVIVGVSGGRTDTNDGFEIIGILVGQVDRSTSVDSPSSG